MATHQYYRAEAERCRKEAETAQDRDMWLKLAVSFDQLATSSEAGSFTGRMRIEPQAPRVRAKD